MDERLAMKFVAGIPFILAMVWMSWFIWREAQKSRKFKQESLDRIKAYDDMITTELTRQAREKGHSVDGYDAVRDKDGHVKFVPYVIMQGQKIPVELYVPLGAENSHA